MKELPIMELFLLMCEIVFGCSEDCVTVYAEVEELFLPNPKFLDSIFGLFEVKDNEI